MVGGPDNRFKRGEIDRYGFEVDEETDASELYHGDDVPAPTYVRGWIRRGRYEAGYREEQDDGEWD